MKHRLKRSNWILFAFIVFLMILAALIGWFDNSLYQNNPADLMIKAKFYDLSLLIFATPVSIIVLILSVKNNKRTGIFSLGLTVYLVFSFVVTIFTCGQNNLFLIYVAIISLCAFYYQNGFSEIYHTTSLRVDKNIAKIVAIVLLFSALSGFGYWLIDAINALLTPINEIDKLQVKVPQVLDMAFVLPFTIYGAIRLLKHKKDGILISLTTMIFFVFIGPSVIILEIGLTASTNIEMDYGKVYSYSFISLINIIITILAYKNLKTEEI